MSGKGSNVILQSICEIDIIRKNCTMLENDLHYQRKQQRTHLYGRSMEDRFVKSQGSLHNVPLDEGSDETEWNTRSPSGKNHKKLRNSPCMYHQTPLSPVKHGKCLANQLLEEKRKEEEKQDERRRRLPCSYIYGPSISPVKVVEPWRSAPYSSFSTPQDQCIAKGTQNTDMLTSSYCTLEAKIARYGAFAVDKAMKSSSSLGHLTCSSSLQSAQPFSSKLRGSPSLCPEVATYTSGSPMYPPHMTHCSSPNYRHPTVTSSIPSVDKHLQNAMKLKEKEMTTLAEAVAMERNQQQDQREKSSLAHQEWKDTWSIDPVDLRNLKSEITENREFQKIQLTTIIKRPTTARAATILYTPESMSQIDFAMRQKHKFRQEKYNLRWKNMVLLVEIMRNSPGSRPADQDIDKLFTVGVEMAFRNLNIWELNRHQFHELLMNEYPKCTDKLLNAIFSSYDCDMQDGVDIRVFVSTIRLLRVTQNTPLNLLLESLRDFDTCRQQAEGMIPNLQTLVSVFCLMSGNINEELYMTERAQKMWSDLITSEYMFEGKNIVPIRLVRNSFKNNTFHEETLNYFIDLLQRRRAECAQVRNQPIT